MQRFFLSCGIFLGSCLISVSSPLFIKSAPTDQPFSANKLSGKKSIPEKTSPIGFQSPANQRYAQEWQFEKAVLILETRRQPHYGLQRREFPALHGEHWRGCHSG